MEPEDDPLEGISRADRVRGAGFDPTTFSGGRVVRALSGGKQAAAEIFILVLDSTVSADAVVSLLRKPTKHLLDERAFRHRDQGGLSLVYCRSIAEGSNELASRLQLARASSPNGLPGPFSDEAFLRIDISLWSFRTVFADDVSAIEVVGLFLADFKDSKEAIHGIASNLVEQLCAETDATHSDVEVFFTSWVRPEDNIVIYRSGPRRVEPHERPGPP